MLKRNKRIQYGYLRNFMVFWLGELLPLSLIWNLKFFDDSLQWVLLLAWTHRYDYRLENLESFYFDCILIQLFVVWGFHAKNYSCRYGLLLRGSRNARRPSPAWYPLAIGGSKERRGVISTANYPARRYGVRSAMPTAMAFKLCPQLTLLPGRMAAYKEASQHIREILPVILHWLNHCHWMRPIWMFLIAWRAVALQH